MIVGLRHQHPKPRRCIGLRQLQGTVQRIFSTFGLALRSPEMRLYQAQIGLKACIFDIEFQLGSFFIEFLNVPAGRIAHNAEAEASQLDAPRLRIEPMTERQVARLTECAKTLLAVAFRQKTEGQ